MAKWLLVTGGTGFVGRNLLLHAVKNGLYEKIIVPVRSPEKVRFQFLGDGFDNIPSKIVTVESSAADWKLASTIRARPEGTELHVVHCAGTLSARTYDEYFKVNVDGTRKLLEELPNADAYVFLSSQAAAGPCVEGMIERREEDQEEPVTFYGASKLEMERAITAWGADKNYLILRPPTVLGPRDTASLPLFQMAKSPVRVKPGREEKYFSFIDVEDLVDAIFLTLERRSQWASLTRRIYFVSHAECVSDREMIEGAATSLKRGGVVIPLPHLFVKALSVAVDAVPLLREKIPNLTKDRVKEILPSRWVACGRPFDEAFQWQAKHSLEHALGAAHEWYRKSGQL